MTTYSFRPKTAGAGGSWTDASLWVGGVVPNSADADVVMPTVSNLNTHQPIPATLVISGAITVDSLQIDDNRLTMPFASNPASSLASLTVEHALTLSGQSYLAVVGHLSAGSIDNDGTSGMSAEGAAVVSGAFVNETVLYAGGDISAGSLDNIGVINGGGSITTAEFDNSGAMAVYGMTVHVSSGGFAQLSSGVLTGGHYTVSSGGSLNLDVGGVITVDATDISLDGGTITSLDGDTYESIGDTLNWVTKAGSLTLVGAGLNSGDAVAWNTLTVDGALNLSGATFAPQSLTVDAEGVVNLVGGAIVGGGSVVDNGLIHMQAFIPGVDMSAAITDPVFGSGSILIGSGVEIQNPYGTGHYVGIQLELGSGDAAAIHFADGTGQLVLDDPAAVSGIIAPTIGDTIRLNGGVALTSASKSYVRGVDGGVLTITTSTGSFSLNIGGDFDAGSFQVLGLPPQTSIDSGATLVTVVTPGVIRNDFPGKGVSNVLLQDADGAVALGALSGGRLVYSAVGALGSEWTIEETGNFLGGSQSEYLMENDAGAVVAGQVISGQVAYSLVTGLGSGWTFEGAGDYLAPSRQQFLIRDAAGDYVAGLISGGHTTYTPLMGLGPEWTVEGSGDYLGNGHDQILLQNANGAVVVADYLYSAHVKAEAFTEVTALGSEWTIRETGDFLGDGKADLLMQDTAGDLVVGEVANGKAVFTTVGALGAEWRFVGVGDFAGTTATSFLIQNTAGAVAMGTVVSGQAQYAQIGALGPDWSFHG